jgi:hypothetical protein
VFVRQDHPEPIQPKRPERRPQLRGNVRQWTLLSDWTVVASCSTAVDGGSGGVAITIAEISYTDQEIDGLKQLSRPIRVAIRIDLLGAATRSLRAIAGRPRVIGAHAQKEESMTTAYRIVTAMLVAMIALGAAAAVAVAQDTDATPPPAVDESAILDGTTDIDAGALADLARERVRLGAAWLMQIQRESGAFYYIYDPSDDEYETQQYNEVRHAGTAYSLYQAYGLLRDESIFVTAESAGEFIREISIPVEGVGTAYIDPQNNDTSLGGQALAIVALMERRRVTGDTAVDPLIESMAAFLLSLEMEDEPGRYYFSYDHNAGRRLPTPDVVFYPGEALLALTRLAEQFPDGPYLDAAVRAADYLVYKRDGDLPSLKTIPREDHWLTIALSELYRLHSDQGYISVAYLNADAMISNQYRADEGFPQRIGAARRDGPICYTSTATKGEAIVAAWGLATFLGDQDGIARFSTGARRNAQFQMRVQYTEESSQLFPQPERLIGGWPASPTNQTIRIDYVQHNISVLIGLWHLTMDGDLPIAKPVAAATGVSRFVDAIDPKHAIGLGALAAVAAFGGIRLRRRPLTPVGAGAAVSVQSHTSATAPMVMAVPAGPAAGTMPTVFVDHRARRRRGQGRAGRR